MTAACFYVTKHSTWKGKYKRVFQIGDTGITTLNPNNLESTNRWEYGDVVDIQVVSNSKTEFLFILKKDKKSDSLKFSTEFRTALLTKALAHRHRFSDKPRDTLRYQAYKHHWSDTRLPVLLEVGTVALNQLDIATHAVLASYPYADIHGFSHVKDCPDSFVIVCTDFSRMHMFSCEAVKELKNKLLELSNNLGIVITVVKEPITLGEFATQRLGKFRGDSDLTSVCEFNVSKVSHRHAEPVRRLLCLSDTCLIERDPQTYNICTLRPLAHISCLFRNNSDPQRFTIHYITGHSRAYIASDRDSLLATLVDSVRGAGNRDVHVEMTATCEERRWGPMYTVTDQEVETLHLKLLCTRPVSMTLAEAVFRFNANVPYSGLLYPASQDGIFTESKEKMITNALVALTVEDLSQYQRSRVFELEAHFHALRRLFTSKFGFAAFTSAPGVRENVGKQVISALKIGDEGVTHAAIDMLCALVHPMHAEPDLRQEQMNKSFVLSSKIFIEKLLDMWTVHIARGTGALVVSAVLDFLTFVLCVPYCETTEGKDFDALLELVATRGRSLFRLFQHSSLAVVKGAGLVMRALVEEGDTLQSARMQSLSLSEGALLRHLHTSLFTPPSDSRQLALRALSRHLVGLWVADDTPSMHMLRRIMPYGLLAFMDSQETVPESVLAMERIAARDNLQMANALSEKNAKMFQWQLVDRQIKAMERLVEDTLVHWGARIGTVGVAASARARERERRERPVVLRRRRERVKASKNWSFFYYQFNLDHAQPNLIWNHKTRGELREAIEGQLREFLAARELAGDTLVSWNHQEFEVTYTSLSNEVQIGNYYLRLLLEKNDLGESPIEQSHEFFNSLYHTLLISSKNELRCQCLHAMSIVYGKYYAELKHFPDTKYILAMLEKSMDKTERDRLVLFIDKLVMDNSNAKAVIDANGIKGLVDLLTLAHLHISRAVVPAQSNVIEAGTTASIELKEWHYQDGGASCGPVGLDTLKEMLQNGKLTARTRCWAAGMESWRSIQQVPQLRWTLLVRSATLLNESELAGNILNILRAICEFYPTRDGDEAVVRPVPRVLSQLSEPSCLPHLVQLLLTFDTVLVERTASLLIAIMRDNPRISTLYLTGVFYFILMYNGSNVLSIARFLKLTHMKQSIRNEDSSASEMVQRSVLSPLLPEAMLHVLENHGAEKFAETFLGDWDTPEVIWNRDMRLLLIQKLAVHVAEFSPLLRSNTRALYKYCAIPAIRYPQLEQELFCNMYYLRHLCDTVKFPNWPIRNPIDLLKDVLDTWRKEVEKKPAAMSVDDAYECLGLARGTSHDDTKVRKAYYVLAQQLHPDKNPDEQARVRFNEVSEAYKFLCSRRCWKGDGPDPNNIVLVLRTQSILFSRHDKELSEYKYAGYPQLVRTIQLEVADDQLFSKTAPLLPAATELAYYTVLCSALNAEELRRERGLDALLDAFSRCVSILSRASRFDDVAVQVCLHVVRCFAVAAQFQGCRDKMLEMPQLVHDVCRILHFQHLTKLCSAATECIAALAVDSILQMRMLQAGVLWHLILFMLDYDYTLEEGGVKRTEEANQQEVCNKLAKLAVLACARLGGYLTGDQASPTNQLTRNNLELLLTPYLVKQLSSNNPEQMLKQLTSNCRNPYLIWDNGTRNELSDYLRMRIESRSDDVDCDLKYSTHENEPRVGQIYLRVFCDQPSFTLDDPHTVVVDLLKELKKVNENSPHVSLVLTSLFHVLQANPDALKECIGYIPAMCRYLRAARDEIGLWSLRVVNIVTRNFDCLADIATADVVGLILPLLHQMPEHQNIVLDTIFTLLSSSKLVKESAIKGLVVHVLWVFCCTNDSNCRIRAAEVLARAVQDKLEGPRIRLVLTRFLPPLLVDAMRDAPENVVRLFDTNAENPELVWDDAAREHAITIIRRNAKQFLEIQLKDHKAGWLPPDEASTELVANSDYVVAGVHLKLFVANPGWAVRRPKEFLVELLDACNRLMTRDNSNPDVLELTTNALVALLQAQPALAGLVPSQGHLPGLLKQLTATSCHAVPRCALLILNQLARNEVCVSALSQWDCIVPLKQIMSSRRDLIGIACDTLDLIFSAGSHQLVRQALDADLVPFLLGLLDSPLEVNNSSMARAQLAKALQSMSRNPVYGERVAALLAKSSVWTEFHGQKHDLFISAAPVSGFLTGVPSVAGYLTDGTERTINEAPPPMDREEPPPPVT